MTLMSPHHFYESDYFISYRDELIERYNEKHRYYHNMWHINDMLNLSTICHPANVGAINLMIWYHDAIYDPTRTDNEERSAELATEHLKDKLDPNDVEYITTGILLTKHTFSSRFLSFDLAILIDCDLYILSHDWYYKMYARNIRKEYSYLTDGQYIKGRIDFLEKMLKKSNWYSQFKDRNIKAEKNMKMELEKLKKDEML